ncbi:unnamed protein product, partial [Effrenium voratum]
DLDTLAAKVLGKKEGEVNATDILKVLNDTQPAEVKDVTDAARSISDASKAAQAIWSKNSSNASQSIGSIVGAAGATVAAAKSVSDMVGSIWSSGPDRNETIEANGSEAWWGKSPRHRAMPALDLLLVRHGESTNNPLMRQIFAPVLHEAPGSAGREAAEQRWLRERATDPGLTPRGVEEAEELAGSLRQFRHARIYVSPFLRTLQTAVPLAKALASAAVVHPEIFEVGGVYTQHDGRRSGPGQCLSAAEIARSFPGFDVGALPERGPWYTGGWESDQEARQRCGRLAQWLRSQEGSMVLVVHAHLIDLLLKALLGIADDPAEDQDVNVMDRAVAFSTSNCGVCSLSLRGGRVIFHLAKL